MMRIRGSGEQEEDHVEQEKDQVVWRAGGRSYMEQEEDHVEQEEALVEQEEDQVVWRAGGGLCGAGG